MIFDKICVAVMCLGAVLAEPPLNNGYLPPTNNGYNYPKPNAPFPPAPAPPAPRPPAPTYGPPAPRPPAPTYGPPAPRPPAYNPPAPAPRPPAYNPAPAPRPPPSYGPPATRPPPQYSPPSPPSYGPPSPPKPSYGPPTGGNGVLPVPQGPQSAPIPGGNQEHGADHVHVPGMPFDFNYAVKDDYYGTDYSHNAISDGDVVKGEYKVLLPDGRLQIVTYTADWKNGFNADVKYQGEPQYPAGNSGSLPGSNPGGSYNSPPSSGSGPY